MNVVIAVAGDVMRLNALTCCVCVCVVCVCCCSKVLPFYIKTILLVMLGIVIVYKMISKGLRLHRNEIEADLKQLLLESSNAEIDYEDVNGRQIEPTDDNNDSVDASAADQYGRHICDEGDRQSPVSRPLSQLVDSDGNTAVSAELKAFLRKESNRFPIRKVAPLFFCWLLLMFETWINRNVLCGSLLYWSIMLSILPLHTIITWLTARRGMRNQRQRERLFGTSSTNGNSNSFTWTRGIKSN